MDGVWSGVYSYVGGKLGWWHFEAPQYRYRPTSFRLTINAGPTGNISGFIDDNGPLGEANIKGECDNGVLRFTKEYINKTPRAGFPAIAPVLYEGVLSQDATRMEGTWSIRTRVFGVIPWQTHGVWEASRE